MTNLSLAWIAAASSAGILIESYDFLIAGAALPFCPSWAFANMA
jgi:hypothetical protein